MLANVYEKSNNAVMGGKSVRERASEHTTHNETKLNSSTKKANDGKNIVLGGLCIYVCTFNGSN